MSNITNDFLAELEAEADYAVKGNRPDRLQIEKNCGAVVRFLPMQMGTNRSWAVRCGKHWFNKKPITCPRATAVSLGGDPQADCPVCTLVDQMKTTADKAIQEEGKKIDTWPKYLTYVFILEGIDEQGDPVPVKKRNLYVPHAFWVPKTAFVELHRRYQKSLTVAEIGFIDPVNGYDVEIHVDGRSNWKIDLAENRPLRDDMEAGDLAAWVDEVCAGVKVDDITIPAYEDLQKYALTIDRQIQSLAESSDEAPSTLRRRAPAEGQEAAPRRRMAEPPAPAPAARRPQSPQPVARRPAPPSQVDQDLDPLPEDQALHAQEEPAAEEVQPTRRIATPAARPLATAVRAPVPRTATAPAPRPAASAPARRVFTAAPARVVTPARRVVQPPEDSGAAEDDVPPETHDPAPALTDDEVMQTESEAPPAPPSSAPRPLAPRRVSSMLQKTLDKGI